MLWVACITMNFAAEPLGDVLGSSLEHRVGINRTAFRTSARCLIQVDFFEVIDEALLVNCDHAHPVHL